MSLMVSQGKKRILLTDDQRRLLAVKGKALGLKALRELTTMLPRVVKRTPGGSEFRAEVGPLYTLLSMNSMIFFGENSLHRATNSFIRHYHEERNHQGLGNEIMIPGDEVGAVAGEVECQERLGGLLRYYHRKAA